MKFLSRKRLDELCSHIWSFQLNYTPHNGSSSECPFTNVNFLVSVILLHGNTFTPHSTDDLLDEDKR